MQAFRSEIKLEHDQYPMIQLSSKVFLIGSCFSDNVGEKFTASGIQTNSNPLGIAYNPASIAKHLERIVKNDPFTPADLMQKGEFFNSFELHGSFDREKAEQLLEDTNRIISHSHEFLKQASHVFITLGTAWVYLLRENGQIVNNCHKLPSSAFEKQLLSLDHCNLYCQQMIDSIQSMNENAEIIFTISPVRHLKDGFTQNSLSKSTLRLAIEHSLQNNVTYFPSYEMVMDDLRDYRFYERDLMHPNEIAVDYIWEKLSQSMMTKETIKNMDRIARVKRSLAHRSLNPGSTSEKDFLNKLKKQIRELSEEFPDSDFSGDLEKIERQLTE